YADPGGLPESKVDVSALTLLARFTALWLELTAMRKAGVSALQEEAQPQAATASAGTSQAAAAAAVAVTEEDEVHKKARRFARLLVDEIRLYNQNKVSEGKQNRDLYQRLKDDIEKSRVTYETRFGDTQETSDK